ncbi:MAG: ADP-glyceromanno-heptose 6-epimerase [Candidatus Neomarinimicrobiota bacterium]
MIIFTGGAGFIGANTLLALNKMGIEDILIVDNIASTEKWKNLIGKKFKQYIHKYSLWEWLKENADINVSYVIHLGACSDTMEPDFDYLVTNNFVYSKKLWELCTDKQIPLIYASSAATYGNCGLGFSDDHRKIYDYKPINPYAYSKHLFDLWVLEQKTTPSKWYGIKFFNVFGPYENHKGHMASVAFQAIPQIINSGIIRLFKSYRDEYKNGEQKRDFLFVSDVVDTMVYLFNSDIQSGIYNVGSGFARSFNDLAVAIFETLNKSIRIEYIDMPDELKDSYQYFTQADLTKLHSTGYDSNTFSLEEGIKQYVDVFFSYMIG